MYRLLAHLHTRRASHAVAATTFCEGCSEICTPTCRHEAIRERTHLRAQEIALYRH